MCKSVSGKPSAGRPLLVPNGSGGTGWSASAPHSKGRAPWGNGAYFWHAPGPDRTPEPPRAEKSVSRGSLLGDRQHGQLLLVDVRLNGSIGCIVPSVPSIGGCTAVRSRRAHGHLSSPNVFAAMSRAYPGHTGTRGTGVEAAIVW